MREGEEGIDEADGGGEVRRREGQGLRLAPGGGGEGEFNEAVPEGSSKIKPGEVVGRGSFEGEDNVRKVRGGAFEEEGCKEGG